MHLAGEIIIWVLNIYIFLMIVRIVMDWIPARWPVWLRPVLLFIRQITEPLLSPLRRVIPLVHLGGGMALDLSPTILILVLVVVRSFIGRLFFR